MIISRLGLPENFADELPNLKSKTLKWETSYKSGTQINSETTISFYQGLNPAIGNLILVPGMATNSKVDPLMRLIQYWGLTHRYNIINIDSFLGDFEKDVTADNANNYTYSELKVGLSGSIRFIQPIVADKHTCIIGHCVSTTIITDIFKEYIKNREEIPVQSAIFFAPFPKFTKSKFDIIATKCAQMKKKNKSTENLDPITALKLKHMKFICAMHGFIETVENIPFEPEIVARWGIPVSLVIAGRDSISPATRAKENFERILKEQGTTKLQYLYLPERKHTFEQLYKNYNDIIQIIKTQRNNTK